MVPAFLESLFQAFQERESRINYDLVNQVPVLYHIIRPVRCKAETRTGTGTKATRIIVRFRGTV